MRPKVLVLVALAACLAPALARPGRALKADVLGIVNVPDPTPVVVSSVPGPTGTEKAGGEVCRAEPLCLAQSCDPKAYKYDVAAAGDAFPYSVSYTTTNDATVTTFIFNVCSKFGDACATAGAAADDPACAPLKSFSLRIKDIMLDTGSVILASPAGQNWASCRPHGPGYLWEAPALGGVANSSAPACAALEVKMATVPGAPATLQDLCKQNVTIVDSDGATVFDSAPLPTNCFFTLENAAGLTGYGTVTDSKPLPEAATTLAVDGQPEEAVPLAGEGPVELATAPSPAPTPYGPAGKRRLHAMRKPTVPGRLF